MAGGYQFNRVPQPVPGTRTRFRQILTPIPAPGTAEILDHLARVESRSMQGQMPIVWDRAVGSSVFDIGGNRYIDFTCTIFVTNIGHANERVLAAVRETLDRGLVHTYAYAHKKRVEYLDRLLAFAGPPFEKAFLLSAGTEATEAALKLMRLHGQQAGKRRCGILCIENNWHGRTMGAQLMSSNPEQKAWIGHQDPDIHHIPFPYPWTLQGRSGEEFLETGLQGLREAGLDLERDLCGVMLETFQGWGAVFYPPDFVQGIETLCRRNGLLLAFDEMQAGFARTGRKFGYEHYDVQPDLLCCGKGMGSGFPLSGVIGPASVMDLPEVGNMSSTHSANPVVCAAGLATLEEIESRNLVAESERKGRIFHDRLNAIQRKFPDRIAWVLGRGMIAALLFQNPETGQPEGLFPSRVCERAMQKGLLLVHTGRESIKLSPPLTIEEEALLEGLDVLEESLAEIQRECR